MRNNAGKILAITLLVATAVDGSGAAARSEVGAPIPDAPARWVTDRAAFLSPAFAQALDTQLGDYQRSTGHQLLVYIDRTTGGLPIEDWAVRAFERWRVGRKGIDDGVMLFIFSDDRRLRIEVGYGLEDRVPDAVASRIISERMVPRIRAGDRDGAVREGVGALIAAIGGKADTTGSPSLEARKPSIWTLLGAGVVALLFLWLLITNPALAAMLILNIGSGSRGGGGGGGGGGGFSGGGRSGGGGASGSW